MLLKIVSIKNFIYENSKTIENIETIFDEDTLISLIYDAEKKVLLNPTETINEFPEQMFPISIKFEGKVVYIYSDIRKPLPNKEQKEAVFECVKQLILSSPRSNYSVCPVI
ncbi:MAG: hypothetical protein A2Y40_05715 [Candidatus Margulisbacteria bacterium GWF2_35_9]|nr:MAG: hypothetical protein A2Y40_05715 [Candidatus Margulisbacteria bacterium GWF2_35_9]